MTAGPARVAVVNLGCRVNRVELDDIAGSLVDAGARLVGEDEARVVVVNTCAVTGEAEAKCRHAIRRALAQPGRPHVVATGCAAALFADELRALGDRVVVVTDKREVAGRALELAGVPAAGVREGGPRPCGAVTPTGRTRPGVKVQDGCDLRCSYCIVWKARGASRSLPVDEVVARVRRCVAAGASEVVLTGINLGRYRGSDAHGREVRLPGLLEELLGATGVGRLRLSSIEPQDVDGRLAGVMAASGGRVAPYLHMCLQSGSDEVLGRMGRVYSAAEYERRADAAREAVPGLALSTDVIVGFPGETERDVDLTEALCRRCGLTKLHVFRYSRRPGTPASVMAGQVDPRVAQARSARLRRLSDELRAGAATALVGGVERVAVEAAGRGVTGGLFDVELAGVAAGTGILDVRVTSAAPDATLRGVPA